MERCVQNGPVLTGLEAHVFIITYHLLIIELTFTSRKYQINHRVQSTKHPLFARPSLDATTTPCIVVDKWCTQVYILLSETRVKLVKSEVLF